MEKKTPFINKTVTDPIHYLEKNRWHTIYNHLYLGEHTDDIIGLKVGGIPLEKVEVEFVLDRLRKKGVRFN